MSLYSFCVQGLRLLQADLSHERYLDEARARVKELEREVETLRVAQDAKATSTVSDTAGAAASLGTKKRGWFW